MKKVLCLLIAFVLMISCSITYAAGVDFSSASEPGNIEKVFSTATLEDNFADDTVILVLTNQASLEFKEHKPSDFSEVACSKIRDLTSYTTAYTQERAQALAEKQRGADTDVELTLSDKEVFSEYNKILLLTLEEKGKQNVLDAIHKLEKREDVRSAEPNYIFEIESVTPNDTYYSQQYACNQINLPAAWGETTGSNYIYVGVIDTGIDASHPELQGRVDTSLSRTFFDGVEATPTTVTDSHGHGTHVAGIIGAATNNRTGISGACWNVKLVSLQVSNSENIGTLGNIIDAIVYATESLRVAAIPDIRVVNISLGLYGLSDSFGGVARTYGGYGGVIVCSAGNDNRNTDNNAYCHIPSWYTIQRVNVISVGSSNASGMKSTSSNYGSTTVDVFVPGENILSCYPASMCTGHTSLTSGHKATGYHYLSGTSMATPYVTGVVALMFAANPNLAVGDVKSSINITADTFSAFNGICISGGRINAYAAVLEAISRDYT